MPYTSKLFFEVPDGGGSRKVQPHFTHPYRHAPEYVGPEDFLEQYQSAVKDLESCAERPDDFELLLMGIQEAVSKAFVEKGAVAADQVFIGVDSNGAGAAYSACSYENEPRLKFHRFPAVKREALNGESLRWLRRRMHKEMRKGRGHREFIALCLNKYVRDMKGVIVTDLGCLEFLYDNDLNPLSKKALRKVDRVAGESDDDSSTRSSRIFDFLIHQSLTISDTPSWVSATKDLLLLLVNTDISNVSVDDVKLPLPVLFIEIPPGTFLVGGDNVVYASVMKQVINDVNGDRLEALVVSMYFKVEGETRFSAASAEIPLVPGADIMELVRDKVDVLDGVADLFGNTMLRKDATHRFIEMIINLVLYITSPSADLKEETVEVTKKVKGRGGGKKKGEVRLNKYQHIVAGTKVRLDPVVREAMRTGGGKRSKVTYSFVVMGHYRWQPHGPKRSLRRRQWIEPFVKGKDLATRIVGHSYEEKS